MELGDREFWDRLAAEPERVASEICSVNAVSLDTTLQQHASLRAWVNAAHEAAVIQEKRCKLAVTKARARALLKAKETSDTHTGKTKTVQVLDAEVETDEEVVKTENLLLDAEEKRGALRAISNAGEDRLQMLIQISAKQRQEARDHS